VVDGLVSGEGNGPLQPLAKQTDMIICGSDPFAVDAVLAWLMGFAPERMPILAHRDAYRGGWGRFALGEISLQIDDVAQRLTECDIDLKFVPPPGWTTHVERRRSA
jgi:uncharacterized protein (DUF362 family)